MFLDSIAQVKKEFEEKPNMWLGSPFYWISILPSRRKGMIGEKILKQQAELEKISTKKAKSSDYDLLINNIKVEVKLSLLWEAGTYVFQQIRDQGYDVVACIALHPDGTSRLWVIPKAIMMEHCIPQHDPDGINNVLWLHIHANNIPEWMKTFEYSTVKDAFISIKKG